MQERARVSSMDLNAHMNNLRKNPKFTEEILKLVESDLQYGLTIEETEMYTSKRFDYAQMKVYSAKRIPGGCKGLYHKGRAYRRADGCCP